MVLQAIASLKNTTLSPKHLAAISHFETAPLHIWILWLQSNRKKQAKNDCKAGCYAQSQKSNSKRTAALRRDWKPWLKKHSGLQFLKATHDYTIILIFPSWSHDRKCLICDAGFRFKAMQFPEIPVGWCRLIARPDRTLQLPLLAEMFPYEFIWKSSPTSTWDAHPSSYVCRRQMPAQF